MTSGQWEHGHLARLDTWPQPKYWPKLDTGGVYMHIGSSGRAIVWVWV